MEIDTYKENYKEGIVELILDIQQNEFHVPVTINDQPDLLDISTFYCKDNGNFWVAKDNDKVIGTIAQVDTGNSQSALRKMFVKKSYRGKEYGVGQLLLDTLIVWCREKGTREVYLGTIDVMKAAHKFYIRNGFVEIEKHQLPINFPVMKVDNKFFKLTVMQSSSYKI
jgi:N-acetylglutamate synthase-like GNAT family acetyltransferase